MSDVSAPTHIRPWKTCRRMWCKIKESCRCINTHAPVKIVSLHSYSSHLILYHSLYWIH